MVCNVYIWRRKKKKHNLRTVIAYIENYFDCYFFIFMCSNVSIWIYSISMLWNLTQNNFLAFQTKKKRNSLFKAIFSCSKRLQYEFVNIEHLCVYWFVFVFVNFFVFVYRVCIELKFNKKNNRKKVHVKILFQTNQWLFAFECCFDVLKMFHVF